MNTDITITITVSGAKGTVTAAESEQGTDAGPAPRDLGDIGQFSGASADEGPPPLEVGVAGADTATGSEAPPPMDVGGSETGSDSGDGQPPPPSSEHLAGDGDEETSAPPGEVGKPK